MWVCGAQDFTGLSQTILDQLVCIGENLQLTPLDSERAIDSLVTEVLKTTVQSENRTLNRADFLRVFVNASSVSVSASSMRKHVEAMSGIVGKFSGDMVSAPGSAMAVSEIPLPARTIKRKNLVSELLLGMGQAGTLWLYGSSGVGKTVLSQLIARRSQRDWLLIELRDCPARQLDFRLRKTIESLGRNRIGGVILDDFPTKHAHASRLRLLMLAGEVRRMDGSILVTSSKRPSPNLLDCFGVECPLLVDTPYLSQEEVADLVESAGGDSKMWAGAIYASCGCGHPQLVQARIMGLVQRNWPRSELLAGLHPLGGRAHELELERDSIRERLMSELPNSARDLLCRLTLIAGYFDRKLAVGVAEVAPGVEHPGEALDILLGPWIETHSVDRFIIASLINFLQGILSRLISWGNSYAMP
jgi:hypothetical protein